VSEDPRPLGFIGQAPRFVSLEETARASIDAKDATIAELKEALRKSYICVVVMLESDRAFPGRPMIAPANLPLFLEAKQLAEDLLG
jgi:hypothetical protein